MSPGSRFLRCMPSLYSYHSLPFKYMQVITYLFVWSTMFIMVTVLLLHFSSAPRYSFQYCMSYLLLKRYDIYVYQLFFSLLWHKKYFLHCSYYKNAVQMYNEKQTVFLIGYSFGSLVAMEMAIQFQEQGSKVRNPAWASL